MLAWRVLHDPHLQSPWLARLLPRPLPGMDRDPLALLLSALACGLALWSLVLGLKGASPRSRGAVIALAAALLVVGPTLAFVALGAATGRPYGQDGGVVQLPLALDRILAGASPYGADYSDSILGKESRVSDFWTLYGGNPILRHHAYLPGLHLIMLPAYLASRLLLGFFDPRFVTLAAWGLGAWLAARLVGGGERGLSAAALFALNPLVYWLQIFGANDVLVATLLVAALVAARAERRGFAAALLGLACATKQLAWPFAPFLLAHLAGLRSFRDLLRGEGWRRAAPPVLVAASVFLAVTVPVAALDPRAFWEDIVAYNVGLPGADNYPLGGTPGFGFANFILYFGGVSSLKDYVPFGAFYLLLAPVLVLLLGRQMRGGALSGVLVNGSVALLLSLYVSRVVHPNYLILAAGLLPLGFLLGETLPADVCVVPLLLFGLAVEVAEHEVLRATWESALSVRMPAYATGAVAALLPRAGRALTRDPLGLALSALAAGSGLLYLLAGLLRPPARLRGALLLAILAVVVVAPTLLVVRVGMASGQPRGEEPWLAQAIPPRPEPPAVLEAWSQSFRRDPPRPLVGSPEPGAVGLPLVGPLLGRLGIPDPRLAALLALGPALLLLRRAAGPEGTPLLWGVGLLSPCAALGLVFGGSDVLVLTGVLSCAALCGRGKGLLGGTVLGLTAAAAPRALWSAPFALAGAAAGLLGLALGYGGAAASRVLPGVSPGPGGALEPGIGLLNVFLYVGADYGKDAVEALGRGLGVLTLALGTALALHAGFRGGGVPGPRRAAWGAAALLAGLWLSPGASAQALGLPLTLLALAAVTGEPPPSREHP